MSFVEEPLLSYLSIKRRHAASGRYGINVADVSDLIKTGIGGDPVSQVFIGERRYDTTVRFPASARSSPEAIGNLVLTSSSGALIPVSQVAQVVLQTGESTITREMNHRHLTVKLNYRGRDLSSLLADAHKQVDEKVSFDPDKYSIEWGGQFENQRREEARVGLILCLALGRVVVLLYPGLGILRQALLILGAGPLATLGR